MSRDFLDLLEKDKNITLNTLYHDYGLTVEAVEAMDNLWRRENDKKKLNNLGLVIDLEISTQKGD